MTVADVTVYTSDFCGYCVQAKRLLKARGVAFVEENVGNDFERRKWLIETTGQRTVPQIFFGDASIGGFHELAALDRAGTLFETLEASAKPSA